MTTPAERSPAVAAVADPVGVAWREGTLTRAAELESLCAWMRRCEDRSAGNGPADDTLREALAVHLDAARQACRRPRWFEPRQSGAQLQRAMSNLDAAEAHLLQLAPAPYVRGQLPSLVNHVQRHLQSTDPRRLAMERLVASIIPLDGHHPAAEGEPTVAEPIQLDRIEAARPQIVASTRGASSAALREQLRVRSFRNVLIMTTVVMTVIAGLLGTIGWLSPDTFPLCFAPEEAGQTTVVCPTRQAGPLATPGATTPAGSGADRTTAQDVDDLVADTVSRVDVALVELIGLTAAAIAAAGTLRGIRGSSEPFAVPTAVALLKLPTGAVTAVLGFLLMRGQFIPGLSALDTSAQIFAWALVFGYAQQLFTRLVDQQAHHVLNSVRNAASKAGTDPAG